MENIATFFTSLFAWQNLLFTTTLGLGTLLFGVQALGLFGSSDKDVDHDTDADHDVDHDVDADHDVDHDVDAGHDVDADHDGGHALEHGPDAHALDAHHGDHALAHGDHDGVVAAALKGLGIGRVPLSMLLPLVLVGFGTFGLVASLVVGGLGARAATFEDWRVLPVLGAAAAGALLVARVGARLFARLAPDAKSVSDKWDLLGLVGVVTTTKVDLELGQVRVKDTFGNELEVPCIARDAARIPKYGEEVVLVDWTPERNRFEVVPFSLDADDATKRLEEGRRRARALRATARRPAVSGR
ncbi:YqiJ family protein [Myxococcota bacterium]|nr:YqiJ family protein [Myxococcota bacterium]